MENACDLVRALHGSEDFIPSLYSDTILQDNQQRGRELKDLVRRALAAGLPVRLGADDMVCNAADLALQLIARDSLMRVEGAGASASASAPPPYIPGPYIASLIRPSTRATRRCGSW